MRQVLPLVITFCLVAGGLTASTDPSAADLLALEGDALSSAIDEMSFDGESTFSSGDLLRIAERLVPKEEILEKKDERFHFSRFFKAACEKASPEEIDKLVDIYVRLQPSTFDKIFCFQNLAAVWIAREIATLDSVPVPIPKGDESVRPELQDAPPDLIAAWQLYKRATRTAGPTFRFSPGKKEISFQANEAAFYRLIDDALLKRGEKIAERLSEFGWSGWSGTGSDFLFNPQSIGIFMVLLREHRLPEAVRAAMELESETILLAGEAKDGVRIAFLAKCGLDWESLLGGALLDSENAGHFGAAPNPYLQELSAYGSDKAATLVTKLAQRAKPSFRADFAEALAAFISEPSDLRYVSGRDYSRITKTRPTGAAREAVIKALQHFATPDAPSNVASTVLKAFEKLKAPGTKGSLRTLLKHPSPEVAEQAATILRSMGEPVEMAARDTTPVRFQISLNGKPLATGLRIWWELRSGPSGSLGSTATVEDGGIIAIDRNYFFDPERKPTAVVLQCQGSEAPDPYFWTEIPMPSNLNEVTRVEVEVMPVELVLRRVKPVSGTDSTKATVRIRRHEPESKDGPENYSYVHWMRREVEFPVEHPVQFSMQKGTYKLEVLLTGMEKSKQEFTVEPQDTSRVNVDLRPGGDLRFLIIRPDGQRGAKSDLLRDGKELKGDDIEFDRKTQAYRGLPCGNYVLHIPSSEGAVSREDGEFLAYAPLQGYRGRDVPFTISGDTPLVDLGEIHLEAAKEN